jgi:hypothetical protein
MCKNVIVIGKTSFAMAKIIRDGGVGRFVKVR